MSTRLHIVVPDELLERIESVRGDVPRSKWIQRALEREMYPLMSVAPDGSVAPVEKDPLFSALGADTFSCPINGCSFQAKSPAAKCSVHGRTVR